MTPAIDKIERISIDKIVPSQQNPRLNLGNLEDLVASIKSVGVLQPPIVMPNGKAGTYELVMGHRRHAAAKLAGLTELEVIVRTHDDIAATKAMIIENVHREDLHPIEEAAAYWRLQDELGMSQAEVAEACGVSQPHVSKRIALLKLPDVVVQALDSEDDKRIPLESAVALTKLNDPKVIEKVFKKAASGMYPNDIGTRITMAVDEHIAHEETAKKIAATKKELRDKGLKILPVGWYPSPHAEQPSALLGNGWRNLGGFKPKAHEGEPCHAVYVDENGKSKPACTDIKRHEPKGASKLKGTIGGTDGGPAKSPAAKKSDDELEAERKAKEVEVALQAAAEKREVFVKRTLAKRLEKDDVAELVTGVYLCESEDDYLWEPVSARRILSLVTGSEIEGAPVSPWDRANDPSFKALVKYADGAASNKGRVAAAHAIIQVESCIAEIFGYNGDRASWAPFAFYFDWLKRKGYEISELEQEQLDLKDGAR